jgi:diacylglycerol kinase family enzyme
VEPSFSVSRINSSRIAPTRAFQLASMTLSDTPTDDQFEVVLFEGRHTARYVKHFAGMMLNRLSSMKGVTVLRADRVALSDPQDRRIYVQIDGEFAGRLPAEIRIVPDALTLLTPPGYGG